MTESTRESESDSRGHQLLAARLEQLPATIRRMADEPPLQLDGKSHRARRFVVTGTGSSEAHARFLLHLLNRHTARAAEFRPLSAFCPTNGESASESCLVVISQGLSPNAQVAIRQRHQFAHAIVFTSSTPAGARAAGKEDLARLLEQLQDEGVAIITSPLEEEYSTLLRFVGPMAVYLRIWQFVAALEPRALPRLPAGDLNRWLGRTAPGGMVDAFLANPESFARGFYFLAASPLCEFGQNLSYKFLEGLFWSAPVVWDFLQFAHGPFQEVTLQPRPVVILEAADEAAANLARRAQRMLAAAAVPCLTLTASLSGPQAIFEFEAMVNDLVMRLIERLAIDQRNWPSKGKDDPLYGFHRFN